MLLCKKSNWVCLSGGMFDYKLFDGNMRRSGDRSRVGWSEAILWPSSSDQCLTSAQSSPVYGYLPHKCNHNPSVNVSAFTSFRIDFKILVLL